MLFSMRKYLPKETLSLCLWIMLCINCHNVFTCYPLYIASLFPLHFIQLAMQIKMTDIIENYEGKSLEAISLLPQFPIYSNYFPSLFNLSFLRNLYIPMNPLIDNRGIVQVRSESEPFRVYLWEWRYCLS